MTLEDEVVVLPGFTRRKVEVDEDDFHDTEVVAQKTRAGVDHTQEWMKAYGLHHFHLVKSADEVERLIDKAIASKYVALDLETQGLDTRVEYRADGTCYTRHAVVGYCLGVQGEGYYIPVRHRVFEDSYQENPNVDSIPRVEAAIRKLCLSSQPKCTDPEEFKLDPVGFKAADPNHTVIFFWNAKFDQEMLFPICGLAFWHPNSFEDGMIAAYCQYSDDAIGLKAHGPRRIHIVKEDGTTALTMIEWKDLFAKEAGKNRCHADLYPEINRDGTPNNTVLYGCSDGIATWLLCVPKALLPSNIRRVNGPEDLTRKNVDADFVAAARHEDLYKYTYRLECQAVQVVREMERNRAQTDSTQTQSILDEAEVEAAYYLKKIREVAELHGFRNFNPSSPEQVSTLLFGKEGLDIDPKPEKLESGIYSTKAKDLEEIYEETGNEFLLYFVKHRQIEKIVGTYLVNLLETVDENGAARLNFNQFGAATGRFTAPGEEKGHGYAKFPIQGIPAKNDDSRPKCANSLRKLFVARKGYKIVKVDYSGQELRIAANVSGEPKWIEEFLHGDGDLHKITAMAFFPGLKETDPDFKEKRKQGKCVHPDTLVYTGNGLRYAGDLTEWPDKPETFKDVSLTAWDGKYLAKVSQFYWDGPQQLVQVHTHSTIFTCTAAHKLLLEDGTFKPAGEILRGDCLHVPKHPQLPKVGIGDELTSATYLLGLRFTNPDNESRRIPELVLQTGYYGSMNFIAGLIDGGSSRNARGGVAINLHPLALAAVASMARCCGLAPQIKHGRRVLFGFYDLRELRLYLRGYTPTLKDRPQDMAMLVEDSMVRKVKFIPTPHDVVDLSMANEEHIYWANGIITHNTANFALIYGGGQAAVQRATNCSADEANVRLNAFKASVPKFAAWGDNQKIIVAKQLGVSTAFKRWIAIPDAAIVAGQRTSRNKKGQPRVVDEIEAKRIRSSCQRRSTNYPIQGCGADVLKYSLVYLFKDFYVRGWLRHNGGDDSVRIIMTVHDEIVFEVREDRVATVVPLICRLMEKPSKVLKWKVPLEVEPLIGDTWEGKYDWNKMLEGKQAPPAWLDIDLARRSDEAYLAKHGGVVPPVAKAPTTETTATEEEAIPDTVKPSVRPLEVMEKRKFSVSAGGRPEIPVDVPQVHVRLDRESLLESHVEKFWLVLSRHLPKGTHVLRLTNHNDEDFIPPALNFKVVPDRLLQDLSDEGFVFEMETTP